MLTGVQNNNGNSAAAADGFSDGRSLIYEIVCDDARRMLAAALQAEVADYIDRFAGEIDENGHRLVVRNGITASAKW